MEIEKIKLNGIYSDKFELIRAYLGLVAIWCAYLFGFWGFRPHI